MSEKTEEPTPKRMREAREKGDSGASAFAAQSIAFLGALVVVPAALRATAHWAAAALRGAISHAAVAAPVAAVDAGALALEVLALIVPVLLAVGLAGGVAAGVQAGGVVATRRLAPDLGRLDLVEGLKGLISGARLFAVARALVGGSLVAYLAYRALRDHAVEIARLAGRLGHLPHAVAEISGVIARDAALAGLALAFIDVLVVRRGWMARLRMSKEEVKREHKESDGDPETKAARERARHEMLAAATVGNVRNASVVIVNPTHLACALRYDTEEGDEAPVLVASGEGDLAAQIVRAAHDYGVPVVQDIPLARALIELEVGDAIPEALYEAVAEILREMLDAQDRS